MRLRQKSDQPSYDAENITLWLLLDSCAFHNLVTRGVTGVTAVLVAGPAAYLAPAAAVTVMLPPQSREPLLLSVCVDVGSNDEANDVEEGYPSGLRQELLSKGQRDGRYDPADLHDGHEAGLYRCANLVECASAGDEGHRSQVDTVLDGRDLSGLANRTWVAKGCGAYNQVADEDLHDLGLDAGTALEELLQDADKDMAKRGSNQSTVDGHLGHTRGEVVAALAPVVGDPRREEFLQTRERS